RLVGVFVVATHAVGGNDRHFLQRRIVGRLGERVLDVQLVQLQRRLGSGQVSFRRRHQRLVLPYLHPRDRLQLELFLVVLESFVGELQRALFHLLVFKGVHQIPVDVLDLRDGCNGL